MHSPSVVVEVDERDVFIESNGIYRQGWWRRCALFECAPLIATETTHTSPPPVIIKHPTAVRVPRGQKEPVYLTCKAEQSVLYDWYKDGRKLHSKGDLNGKLVLFPGADIAGEYHCVVVNDGGTEASTKARVTIGRPLHLTFDLT